MKTGGESQPPIQYTVRVFDRALNPQLGSAVGIFRQLGAVGRGNPLPGGTVQHDTRPPPARSPLA